MEGVGDQESGVRGVKVMDVSEAFQKFVEEARVNPPLGERMITPRIPWKLKEKLLEFSICHNITMNLAVIALLNVGMDKIGVPVRASDP
jgi:hypothetical protein